MPAQYSPSGTAEPLTAVCGRRRLRGTIYLIDWR